ncbi:MAG: hypothetical protein Q8942_05225 [Bacillota bacterium]|nr:hypothetical protein [Bacillota bacterium]
MKKAFMVIMLGALLILGLMNIKSYAAANTSVVEGMVYTPEGGAFVEGEENFVEVRLVDSTSGDVYNTYPESDGSFYFTEAIPDGSYDLYAYAFGNNSPYSNSEKISVQLQNGVAINQELDLTYPAVKGTIYEPSGDLYYPDADSNVYVYIYPEDSKTPLEKCEVFDDGTYKISGDIPEGNYLIKAVANGSSNPFMNSEAEWVSITPGSTSETDLELGMLSMRGMVYTPDGDKFIPNDDSMVSVCLYDESDPSKQYTADVNDGEYRFGSEVPEGDYGLVALYEGSENLSDSESISVSIIQDTYFDCDLSLTYSSNRYSVSGFLKPDFTVANTSVYAGFKVEVVGTEYSDVTDSKGYFEMPDILSPQSAYTLRISKAGYLTREINISDITGDKTFGTQANPVLVWAGDIPKSGLQDGVVNMADIVELSKAFNSTTSNNNYNQNADFNMDNCINMNDVIIMAKNFNKKCEDYPVIK